MATVTGFTAERAQEIEDQAIVDGTVIGDDLILTRNNADTINAGNVRGAVGPAGPPGGLGEAPSNGNTYGRKDAGWAVVPPATPEAPADGKAYARQNGAWIIAPGSLLGSEFNDTDSVTALATAVSFGGGGTSLVVAVGSRGVTVEFGAILGHSLPNKFVGAWLYVDGVAITKAQTLDFITVGGGVRDVSRTCTFDPGELSIGNHTFEVKAKQTAPDASMAMYQSQLSIRSN